MVGEEYAPLGTTNYAPYLTKALEARPDVVGLVVFGAGYARVLQQLKQMGLTAHIHHNFWSHSDAAAAGDAVLGMTAGDAYALENPKVPRAAAFAAAYHAAHQAWPNSVAARGYNAVEVLALAIQQAGGPDPGGVVTALEKIVFSDSVLGEFRFRDCDHQAVTPSFVVEGRRHETYRRVRRVRGRHRRHERAARAVRPDPVRAAHAAVLMALLRIQDLTRRFGGLSVLSGVALSIAPGEVRSVIGPNGAGKTTLFNIVTGAIPPTSGRIFFGDRDITGLSPAATFRLGIVRSFQVSQLFPRLTARESVRLMVEGRFRTSGAPASRVQIGVADIDRRVDAALERLGIAHRAGDVCGWLAHGERRLVEMAMVIAAEPALLLLDEPTAGMTPDDSLRTADLLRSLAPRITLLIVEHDMRVVMRVSDRVSVLHQGRILSDGTADEILHDPQVEAVYLGRQARDGRRTA